MASRKPPSPGDVLLTTYGVAVVINICEPSPEIVSDKENTAGNQNVTFKARLWREPGKSVGSSATAFLQCGSVSDCYSNIFNGLYKYTINLN